MIKELIKIANRLDSMGLKVEADRIDGMIRKIASNQPIEIPSHIFDLLSDIVQAKEKMEIFDNSNELSGLMNEIYTWAEESGLSSSEADELVSEHSRILKKKESDEMMFNNLKLRLLLLKKTLTNLNKLESIYEYHKALKRGREDTVVDDAVRFFGENPGQKIAQLGEFIVDAIRAIFSEDYSGAADKLKETRIYIHGFLAKYSQTYYKPDGFELVSWYGVVYKIMGELFRELERHISGLNKVVLEVTGGNSMTEEQKSRLSNIYSDLMSWTYEPVMEHPNLSD